MKWEITGLPWASRSLFAVAVISASAIADGFNRCEVPAQQAGAAFTVGEYNEDLGLQPGGGMAAQ